MVLTYFFGFSRRWEMIFLLCSGVAINYTLRVNISVAAPSMKEELNWNEKDRGYVLSAFYWGYALGQVPSSKLAQVYHHLFHGK
jgi:sugar phosphate permease